MLELSDKLPISAIYGKWENTLGPYTAAGGQGRGRGRDIGEQWVSKLTGVEREKGKEQKTREGTLVKEKRDLSWSILL